MSGNAVIATQAIDVARSDCQPDRNPTTRPRRDDSRGRLSRRARPGGVHAPDHFHRASRPRNGIEPASFGVFAGFAVASRRVLHP